jgi:PEP-CTERM/exosortase A-associated glycosyltransferase
MHLTGPKHDTEDVKAEFEDVDGFRFYRSDTSPGFLGRLPILNQWRVIRVLERRIREVAEQLRPDIIHAHSPALNGVAAVLAGRKLGIPVVYEVRAFWEDAAVSHGTSKEGGLRYRLTRAMESWVFKRAQAVTCICEGLRADIASRGVPVEKITVIPNAVDASRFTPITERDPLLEAELGLSQNRVIGFIGSFYDYEGLDLLVAAMPALLQTLPDLRLLLVGGGQVMEELHAQVIELGLTEQVIFSGRVPHDQVDRYYSLVDILVYPRKSMRLTELVTPLKPLEAMAQKKLFLASDVGGHKELVIDGETGTLFRADDVSALTEALIKLYSEEDRWPAFWSAGRKYVEQERNWKNSVANIAPVYERLNGSA